MGKQFKGVNVGANGRNTAVRSCRVNNSKHRERRSGSQIKINLGYRHFWYVWFDRISNGPLDSKNYQR